MSKSRKEIIANILEKHPKIGKEELSWRADGRLEWGCAHGVGHTIYSRNNNYVHGCDGCCSKILRERK